MFYFNKFAGESELVIKGEELNHFKARREKVGNIVKLSALDGKICEYEISEIRGSKISLKLQNSQKFKALSSGVKIALAVIEFDSICEILPYLNELGVDELFLVQCEFSSFKMDEKKLAKLEKIALNSSEQCMRANVIKIKYFKNLAALCEVQTPKLIDFCPEKLCEFDKNELYLIGPEGGFSESERQKFERFGLKSKNILKAKNAVISVAAKMLI